jgi:hypothetical protein
MFAAKNVFITLPAEYPIVSGTRAPVLGASSASPWPPVTGGTWVSLQRASVDDNAVHVPFPFTWAFNGTGYTGCYIGSNAYITFGAGSSAYSGLSASNPAINKIMMNAADRSYQSVAYLSTPNYVRVRYEGTATTSGTPGASTSIYEVVFTNPANTKSLPTVEFRFGVWADVGGVTGIYSTSAALTTTGTFAPTLNSSVVLQGSSSGLTWTAYASSYLQGL